MQRREVGFYGGMIVWILLMVLLIWASTTNKKGTTDHEPRPTYSVSTR